MLVTKDFMQKFSDSKMSSEGSNLVPDNEFDDIIPGPMIEEGMETFIYIFVYDL